MENVIQTFKLHKNQIQILSFNCGKHVSTEQLKSGKVKIIRNEVVYDSGFYCCPKLCRRSDEN